MSMSAFVLALFLGTIVVPPLPPIWDGLRAGAYGAGISVLVRDGIRMTVWYPSSKDGKAITVGQFAASSASFAGEAGVDGLPADVISRYRSRELFARADATRAAGRFPFVVIAQGNQQGPLHQAVLAEFLASHGFVVATATSTTITSPMRSADDVGPAAQREAEQLQTLIDAGKTLPQVDRSRVSVVGHSFGARAALLLAMHDPTINALVSLDGGIGTSQSMESYRRASWFATERATVPILHFYETSDAFMAPEFTLLRSLPARSLTLRKVDGLHHVHFTTLGFAAALDPALANVVQLDAKSASMLGAVFDELLSFLQAPRSR